MKNHELENELVKYNCPSSYNNFDGNVLKLEFLFSAQVNITKEKLTTLDTERLARHIVHEVVEHTLAEAEKLQDSLMTTTTTTTTTTTATCV